MKNKIIEKPIYNICSVIHRLCKLNLEFIGLQLDTSFNLISTKIPSIFESSKVKTFSYIHYLLKSKQPHEIIHYTDNFRLSYLSVGFFEQLQYKGTIILGPFLSSIPNDAFISKIIEKNNLSLTYKLQFKEYYNALPIYDYNDTKDVSALMLNLASNPFISGNILYSDNENNDIATENNSFNSEEFTSEIELRYRLEKEILNAVEKGLKEEALNLEKLFHFQATHRAPSNPLRANKNVVFSFNTLLRTACERGGVSPIYISNLSDKFAILIENISTMAQFESMTTKMISEYCDLVNKYSTNGYSSIIKKAINYINLNFKNQISLNLIAESININPSHLSRQFKKETNMTITEFINIKRINEAKFLIEQNQNSITEIALMVGFENHNYFCKVFKQITALTTKEYLKKCH
jgi:YesN/AraC family two-component response regulator